MKANDVRAYLEGIVRGAFGHIWLGSTKGGISVGLGTSGAIGVFPGGGGTMGTSFGGFGFVSGMREMDFGFVFGANALPDVGYA